MRARRLLPALALIGLASTGIALPGCSDDVDTAAEPIVRPVRYIEVTSARGPQVQNFSGVARAGEEARLSFRVSGRLEALAMNVGDEVTEGQVLGQLDGTDFALQVQEARAAGAQARAQQRSAQATYQRTRALYENGNASRQQLDEARAASDSMRMQVAASGQQLRLIQRQLEYCQLTAPSAGRISQVLVEANENVQAGAAVAVLLAGEQLNVEVPVPETSIARIERGAAVAVRFDAIEDRSFAGDVFEVGVSGGASATFPVTIRLTEGEGVVRAGMAASVQFTFEREADAPDVVVPLAAVGEDREGRFVFVVERGEHGRGTVHRTPVDVGRASVDGLEIIEGVTEGALVVTAGVSRIQDGLEVRVPEEPETASGDESVAPEAATPEAAE